jgi:hypothetical protein
MFPLLVMAAAEIDVGKMSEVADNNKKITVQWILLPSLLLPLSRPADVGFASRAVIQSGHYHKTPRIKEEICMTIGGSARPTLTSRDDGRKDDGSNEGGARVGVASRDPQSYPRRWYLSLILYFRGSERKACPEEADGGDLAAGQHPKPPFSLLSHLPIYVAAAAAAAWRRKKRMKTTAVVGSGRRKKSGGGDNGQ